MVDLRSPIKEFQSICNNWELYFDGVDRLATNVHGVEVAHAGTASTSRFLAGGSVGVGIGVTHQDDQNIKNDKDGLYLPDYTRWDAAGYYTISDDLEIRVNIENFSDEIYFPYSHSTHQASVGKDVNARLSITKRF